MKILVTGATGLIGSQCVRALRFAGHSVVAGMRNPPPDNVDCMAVDFSADLTADTWMPRLRGFDVVVNAVGIFTEHGAQTFDALHWQAPQALFAASAEVGVRRIIQVSALGADAGANTRFLSSKKLADDFLASLPISAVIVQPSLVFSEDGSSSKLFALIGMAPLLPLTQSSAQIQPVFIDDLVEGITRLVEAPIVPERVAAVGGSALALSDYLQLIRARMGFSKAVVLHLPASLIKTLLRMPGASQIASADALSMLERGNVSSTASLAQILGRAPATPCEFVTPMRATRLRQNAALQIGTSLLRVTIALMWIVTGVVSMGLYPIADSLELLGRTGLWGLPAQVALFGAAVLDVLLGIATLVMRRRWVWNAQALLILTYTVIISIHLPEYWLHPYGPILKNLPLLAAIVLMRNLERR